MPSRLDRLRSLAARSRFRVGSALVHPDRLLVERDGQEYAIEPRAMEVLTALAEHAGEVVSAEQLLIEVWRGSFYGDNPVHRAIAQLRRQLGDDPRRPRFIETIRKRGYRLSAPVSFPDNYQRQALPLSSWAGRNPYVGLTAFDGSHADVFFGRSRLTASVLNAVRCQLEAQQRFVLLVGASGCGKTSLLHAGVLPLMRQPGGFGGVRAAALACCDLAAAAEAPLVQLARALGDWRLGDRPVLPPLPVAALADALGSDEELLSRALDQAQLRQGRAEAGAPPSLLLVIDHAESLVTTRNIDGEQRATFWRVIESVCAHPLGCVLMSVRGDFYASLIEALPGIEDRKRGEGHIDVLAPRAGEIAQIVRMPASLAGLSFEEDAQSAARLDDVLRDAAALQPDALPLLQHTLQALFEQRTEDGVLSFAAYHAVGGLEGAIGHRAEAVFQSLPEDIQRQLDVVLSHLVLQQPGSDTASAQRVLREALPGRAAQTLVEAFIQARLFVGGSSAGRADFGLAHEALLRQWPRAREWTREHDRLLRAATRFRRATERWREAGRRVDHLLNEGQPLEEALDVANRLPHRLTADDGELLKASLRQRQRRQRRRRLAAAGLLGLCVLSSGLALWASAAQREAEHRRESALQLIDYMLVELADKLRPLGRLDLLHSVSSKALDHLGEGTRRFDPDQALTRARGMRTLGEVLVTRQQFDEAVPILQRAAGLVDAVLLSPGGDDEALHFEAGQIAFWQGQIAFWKRDFEAAHGHWQRYLVSARAFAALSQNVVQGQRELAYAYNNLGTIAFARHRLPEALADFERAARLRRELQQSDSDVATALALIDTLAWTAQVQAELGQAQAAIARFEEGLDLLASLRPGSDEASARRRELSLRFALAQLLYDLEQPSAAERELSRALALARADVANDPSQPRRQALLAHVAFRLARSQQTAPDLRSEAMRQGKEALAKVELSNVSALEKTLVRLEGCITRLTFEASDSGCIAPLLPELAAATGADAPRLASAVTELAVLAEGAPSELVETASRLLDHVPPARRGSLRYRLSAAALQPRLQLSHSESPLAPARPP